MTKQELINSVAKRTNVKIDVVAKVINTSIEEIQNNLTLGNKIYINGLFVLSVKKYKERLGRNISQGTAVTIPSRYKPIAWFSKKLIEKVNNNIENSSLKE